MILSKICHPVNIQNLIFMRTSLILMLRFVWGIVNENKDNTKRKTEKLDKKSDEFRVHDDQLNQRINDIDKRKQ